MNSNFNQEDPSRAIKSVNFSVSGAIKSEKVQPVFRLIEDYDKRLLLRAKDTPSRSSDNDKAVLDESRKRGDLFAKVTGPVWHKFTNTMMTPPIIPENLPLQFKDLDIYGAPFGSETLDEFEDRKIREFVGSDLDYAEYEELKKYCNPDNLKTGKELKMSTGYPVQGLIAKNLAKKDHESDQEGSDEKKQGSEPELWTLKRLKRRQKTDKTNAFPKFLKYRGVKHIPLKDQKKAGDENAGPPDLVPGKDLVYRVRVYRPFTFHLTGDKHVRTRHSVFECDIVVTGGTPLTALRDRFTCRNDLDMRLDMSNNPDAPTTPSAKTVFPSGFLFINNVFYVDGRVGCRDMSACVRRWALQRGLGDFPVRRLERRTVSDLMVRLAHPEVYVHQGSCEHVFLFSEIRLLNRSDPLHLSAYPCHTLMSQNQSIYCTTCAEFTAKWLVTGSDRVPFDPAFFCDVCFKGYMYRGDEKIGDFKAYPYRGNEINVKHTPVSSFQMVLDYN